VFEYQSNFYKVVKHFAVNTNSKSTLLLSHYYYINRAYYFCNMWYLILGVGVGYFLFKYLLINRADYKALVAQGAVIIDVRTPGEFASGNVPNSKNIPLNNLSAELSALQGKKVIAVCASGMRSGNACKMMRNAGIECYNAGAWSTLRNKLNA
jgi:phage shock protein E